MREKEGEKILNRTNESIETFENPNGNKKEAKKGGSKTKRKLINRKAKSKRVRFAI